MISGEEVMGIIKDEQDGFYMLKEPASIMMTDQGNGKVGVGIAPYMPYAKEKQIQINKLAVAAVGTAADELEAEYQRIFGHGIITPRKGLIGA
jgi:hypothetical protein